MTEQTRLFWAMADCIRENNYRIFTKVFSDLNEAREKISEEILVQNGVNIRSAKSIMKKIKSVDIEKAQKNLIKIGAKILFYEDEDFPENLKNIADPPFFLFYKGDLSKIPRKRLAVVGSRTVSDNGKFAIEKLLPKIISGGFSIISGMAAGIDTLAHKKALSEKGHTVAFWGTGLDICYPSGNFQLAQEIEKSGVVFSEFPLGTQGNPYNFPRRNRLVSGFSDGVLVIEGKKKSGSLITADFAMEQGKEVFAVPGPIRSPLSEGPHILIQNGVKLAMQASDILEEFGITESAPSTHSTYIPQTEKEKSIWNALSYNPISFDILSQKTQIPTDQLTSEIMMMTLQGAIDDVGNAHYVRK
jgi:DNA processing protein